MQHRPAGGTGCQDPLISIQDGTLAIRRYYFPTGTKRVRLASITGVEHYPMSKATGRWRTWGSGDLIHWLNLDPGRRHKRQAFIIDLGRRAKPVVTPDDPDAFRAALVAAGIRLHGRVAFAADRRRNVDLYQLELPSGRLRQLTTSPDADLSPTWAPDGKRLAFRSGRDGSAVTRLTRAGSEEQEPALVPCKEACA